MEEEDKVVTLLASLPDSFNMLVTALEANAGVPSMEVVTERLFHEDRKANERETASSEKLFLGKKSKKKGPQCHGCGKFGHIRRYCKELDKNKHTKESKPEKHKASSAQDNRDLKQGRRRRRRRRTGSNFPLLGCSTHVTTPLRCPPLVVHCKFTT